MPLRKTAIEKPGIDTQILSFFSGAGFLDLGFEHAGHNIAFVNEFHEPFLEAYKYSRKKLNMPDPEYGYHNGSIEGFLRGKQKNSLRKIVNQIRKNGNLVGFIGGPPCPDFSVGGKNKGNKGENGRLSGVYVTLITQQRPDFFVVENVKGLWRTKRHRAFYNRLKKRLENAGYDLHDKLINAISYGVPQDRDRIILVGIKKGYKTNSEFPWNRYALYEDEKAFEFNWPKLSAFRERSKRKIPKGIPPELTVEHWFQKNSVEKHPNYLNAFRPKAGLKRFKKVDEGDDSKKSFKRLHRWRYSPTASYGNNEVHLHPYKARRISAAEALAIQSLPKKFELPQDMTLTNMFKTIGNGVPYLAALAIGKSVKDQLSTSKKQTKLHTKSYAAAE